MTTLCEHYRQTVNQVVNLRLALLFDQLIQIAADGLKSLLQQIKSRHESLISGQSQEEMAPVLVNELVKRFLLEQAVEMSKQVNGHQFLVSKDWLRVIAQALKTGLRTSI